MRQAIPRSGFALLSALITIVLLTALSTATFFRTTQNARIAYATTLRQHAFFNAERALWTTLSTVNPTTLHALTPYTTLQSTTEHHDLLTRISTTKLTPSLYWIVVKSTIDRGPIQATYRIAISARMTRNPTDSTLVLIPTQPHSWITLQ